MTKVAELDTPVATVDLDKVERNIRRAQQHLSGLGPNGAQVFALLHDELQFL